MGPDSLVLFTRSAWAPPDPPWALRDAAWLVLAGEDAPLPSGHGVACVLERGGAVLLSVTPRWWHRLTPEAWRRARLDAALRLVRLARGVASYAVLPAGVQAAPVTLGGPGTAWVAVGWG